VPLDLDQEFGEGAVAHFATPAAAEAIAHIATGRHLRAAISAAPYVFLTAKPAWSDADQQRMADVLQEEVERGIANGDYLTAAWRAPYVYLLTGNRPWRADDAQRLLDAVSLTLGGAQSWDHPSYAGRVADYLILGGRPFWTPEQLDLMLAALREDFGTSLKNQDATMIADRLARFRILAETRDSTD
jgi:hypothetical protein